MSKTIHVGKTEYIDVIAIDFTGRIYPGTKPPREWFFLPRMIDIFRDHGEYFLTVKITGESIPTEVVRLRFVWSGNYETSILEKIDKSTSQT